MKQDKERRIEQYLEIESKLATIFKKTGYCRDNCEKLPEGCCSDDCVDTNLGIEKEVFESFNLQRKKLYKETSSKICRYHSDKGCILETHKPVICLSHICEGYELHLKKFNIHLYTSYLLINLRSVLNDDKETLSFKEHIDDILSGI